MVLGLNMMDEAERKGIVIHHEKLSDQLSLPVIPTVASKGRGVDQLFKEVIQMARSLKAGQIIKFSKPVEKRIQQLEQALPVRKMDSRLPGRLLAIKVLENDPHFTGMLHRQAPGIEQKTENIRQELADVQGRDADEVINLERHGLSMSLFESVCKLEKPRRHWKDQLDNVLMHPLGGYLFLLIFLMGFFYVIFHAGAFLEGPLLGLFSALGDRVAQLGEGVFPVILKSAVDGIGGGIAIVLPYLLPFLFGLSLFEDIGYLPRIAFLMDALMHRMGLHGTAIIPLILGYGCNVPAIMATRIIDSPRDRIIASLLATMVPCAGRMVIIFGLVGYYMGGLAAFLIYILNILIIGITGGLLSRMLPEATPGMLLEMPAYQLPQFKVILRKTWMRIKEFIVIAWPLLIIGSVILSLLQYLNWTPHINTLTRPFTRLLGLPPEVGMTLIFGVLRKELSMLMLIQAFGTQNLNTVMTFGQMLVFTVFVVFYIPCLAAIGALYKQGGLKKTILIVLYTLILAFLLGMLTRLFSIVIF